MSCAVVAIGLDLKAASSGCDKAADGRAGAATPVGERQRGSL